MKKKKKNIAELKIHKHKILWYSAIAFQYTIENILAY